MPNHAAPFSWVGSVRDDLRDARRRLRQRPATSAAAIASLALAIGTCLAAFQLAYGLLFRPLPIAGADRLYAVSHASADANGRARWIGAYEYPLFERLRDAARPEATVLAVSPAERVDVTYAGDAQLEAASVQYTSATLFARFGLQPSLGRVLAPADDGAPGAGQPVAVLAHDYWRRRFGGDPAIVGRPVRVGDAALTIVGVAPPGFRGTETGAPSDLFVPASAHPASRSTGDSWIRVLVHLEPGARADALLERLQPVFVRFREERARTFRGLAPAAVQRFLAERIEILPAPAGVSGLQQEYRLPLAMLGVLALLVLGIACANLANLHAVRTAARGREIAIRVAIGAGRGRLVQAVVVEAALVAGAATVIGCAFAAWASRLLLARVGSVTPVDIELGIDGRGAAVAAVLALGTTLLFALAPASRASRIAPVAVIRGDTDRRRRRLAPLLVAGQAAFCAVVVALAALFAGTFDRLAHQAMGFSARGVLLVDASVRAPRPLASWEDARAALAAVPGVDAAALAAFPLLSGRATNGFVSIGGAAPQPALTYFLNVSPGWLDAMGVPLRHGRDFTAGDARPGTAIVNEAFVRAHFGGRDPVGHTFDRTNVAGRFTIVGVVADARYRDLRGPIQPTAYLPFRAVSGGSDEGVWGGTFVLRTGLADPAGLADVVRRTIGARQPSLLVGAIRTQRELVEAATRRERLLATLAVFFAGVALLLAGVGLYATLDGVVTQRRRELGIRLAIGASRAHVVRTATAGSLAMVAAGAVVGSGAAVLVARLADALIYEVGPGDPAIAAAPWLTLAMVAAAAALRPALQAVRIDPARTLQG